jgi:hypothetical protein
MDFRLRTSTAGTEAGADDTDCVVLLILGGGDWAGDEMPPVIFGSSNMRLSGESVFKCSPIITGDREGI